MIKWWMIHLTDLKAKIYSAKKTAEGLKIIYPKTPKFYITPKVHKENNPVRPFIFSVWDYMLCWHQLQPLVKVILLYIKDTNDFINKTNFKVPEDSFLVTMDVKAFYTCIPNNEGNAAVKQKHDNYTKKNIVSKSRSHIFRTYFHSKQLHF